MCNCLEKQKENNIYHTNEFARCPNCFMAFYQSRDGRKQYSKPRVHPLHCVEHNTLRTRSAQQIGPRANQPPNNTMGIQ